MKTIAHPMAAGLVGVRYVLTAGGIVALHAGTVPEGGP